MKKKREVVLDFTSLLDVTLIIIFFFVLFSHLDQENKDRILQDKIKEYDEKIEEAIDREGEAVDLANQLEKELDIVKESSNRRGSDVDEILDFNRSKNIKIILDMNDDSTWETRILHDEEVLKILDNNISFSEDLLAALSEAGYSDDDTIFCEFIFDGSIPGTASAYKAITEGINYCDNIYSHLYVSETDLSTTERN